MRHGGGLTLRTRGTWIFVFLSAFIASNTQRHNSVATVLLLYWMRYGLLLLHVCTHDTFVVVQKVLPGVPRELDKGGIDLNSTKGATSKLDRYGKVTKLSSPVKEGFGRRQRKSSQPKVVYHCTRPGTLRTIRPVLTLCGAATCCFVV